MKALSLIVVGFLMVISKPSESISGKAWVISVIGPRETKVDVPCERIVSFKVYSGCGQFKAFEERKDTVIVIADYGPPRPCTMNLPTRVAAYTFKRHKPGRYILFFKGSNSNVAVCDTIWARK
jgi:hypothetical protein